MNPSVAAVPTGGHPYASLASPRSVQALPVFVDEESMNILCINCQEFISLLQIEEHSRTCVTISETVRRMDMYSPLVQVRFKLERLRDLLSSLLNDRPGDSNYCSIFVRLIAKLLEVKETTDVDKNQQVSESLSSLLLGFKGSNALLIYGERLKALAYEQCLALREAMDDELPEVLQTRQSHNAPSVRELKEIHSETSSVFSMNTDFTPSVSQYDEAEPYLIEFSDAEDESLDKVDLQRYFYSQCLAIKLTYNSRSQAQYVSISKLYDEVKRLKLPLDRWTVFIRQELRHPDKWIETADTRKPKNPQPKNYRRAARFEPIVEEEESPKHSRQY
jgi:hypothetical protein